MLLLWTARIEEAERQFRLAAATQPGSPLAREAERYLETIRRARASRGLKADSLTPAVVVTTV